MPRDVREESGGSPHGVELQGGKACAAQVQQSNTGPMPPARCLRMQMICKPLVRGRGGEASPMPPHSLHTLRPHTSHSYAHTPQPNPHPPGPPICGLQPSPAAPGYPPTLTRDTHGLSHTRATPRPQGFGLLDAAKRMRASHSSALPLPPSATSGPLPPQLPPAAAAAAHADWSQLALLSSSSAAQASAGVPEGAPAISLSHPSPLPPLHTHAHQEKQEWEGGGERAHTHTLSGGPSASGVHTYHTHTAAHTDHAHTHDPASSDSQSFPQVSSAWLVSRPSAAPVPPQGGMRILTSPDCSYASASLCALPSSSSPASAQVIPYARLSTSRYTSSATQAHTHLHAPFQPPHAETHAHTDARTLLAPPPPSCGISVDQFTVAWGPPDFGGFVDLHVVDEAFKMAAYILKTQGLLKPARTVAIMKTWTGENYKQGRDVTRGVMDYVGQMLDPSALPCLSIGPSEDEDPNTTPSELARLQSGNCDHLELPSFIQSIDDSVSAVSGFAFYRSQFVMFANQSFAETYMTTAEMNNFFRERAVLPSVAWSRIIAKESLSDFFVAMVRYVFCPPYPGSEARIPFYSIDRRGCRRHCLGRVRYVLVKQGQYSALVLSVTPMPQEFPQYGPMALLQSQQAVCEPAPRPQQVYTCVGESQQMFLCDPANLHVCAKAVSVGPAASAAAAETAGGKAYVGCGTGQGGTDALAHTDTYAHAAAGASTGMHSHVYESLHLPVGWETIGGVPHAQVDAPSVIQECSKGDDSTPVLCSTDPRPPSPPALASCSSMDTEGALASKSPELDHPPPRRSARVKKRVKRPRQQVETTAELQVTDTHEDPWPQYIRPVTHPHTAATHSYAHPHMHAYGPPPHAAAPVDARTVDDPHGCAEAEMSAEDIPMCLSEADLHSCGGGYGVEGGLCGACVGERAVERGGASPDSPPWHHRSTSATTRTHAQSVRPCRDASSSMIPPSSAGAPAPLLLPSSASSSSSPPVAAAAAALRPPPPPTPRPSSSPPPSTTTLMDGSSAPPFTDEPPPQPASLPSSSSAAAAAPVPSSSSSWAEAVMSAIYTQAQRNGQTGARTHTSHTCVPNATATDAAMLAEDLDEAFGSGGPPIITADVLEDLFA